MERERFDYLAVPPGCQTETLMQATTWSANTFRGFRRSAGRPVDCRRMELEAADV